MKSTFSADNCPLRGTHSVAEVTMTINKGADDDGAEEEHTLLSR